VIFVLLALGSTARRRLRRSGALGKSLSPCRRSANETAC
jgi:hypothetical protein